MGSEYLTTLKNVKFYEMETKIHDASMMYKGIEWLSKDTNPLRKKLEDYESVVSTSCH